MRTALAELHPSETRPATAAAAPARARWLALDLFRFAAVCLMVQGHVFTTLLDRATKSQGWYPHHSFVHGYTAPMFLFGAGLAFGYTTFRGWKAHAAGGPPARARFKRYAWLLIIGYGLHLPTLSLSRLLSMDAERLSGFFRVDVLQHIGVSLAICQLLVFLVKRQRIFINLVAAMALVAIFASPWLWNIDVSGAPPWLSGYLNASTGSTFPLVPWCGFTYVGILAGYAVGTGGDVSTRVRWPFAAGAVFFLLAPVVVDRFGFWPWPEHNFWKTNPLFFFWRLGNVLSVLAILCFVERGLARLGWVAAEAQSRLTRFAQGVVGWVKLVGAETLIIYVMHLVVLHGSVLGPGLKHSEAFRAGSHGVPMATLVTVLLFAAMVLLAKGWSELRKVRMTFNAVQISLTSLFALLMLITR